MKKILLFMLVLSVFSTHSLAFGNYSAEKQNYLKKNFVTSTTSQYDPMDVLGILNFLMQYSEDNKKWNYEIAGFTWNDMVEAINGNPDVVLNKYNNIYYTFTWEISGNLKVLTKLNFISYNIFSKYSGTFDGKYFKNLQVLDLSHLKITSLNVSNNTKLVDLRCADNLITILDVSKNSNLEILWCEVNNIKTLDVSKNRYLSSFDCSFNEIKVLDISKNNQLEEIYCSGNKIRSLNIPKNPRLKYLECYGNELKVLDVSEAFNLVDLNCSDNKLNALDVSKITGIKRIDCAGNLINTLDLSNNYNLEALFCYDNQLTALDLSKNKNFYNLICYNNQLKFSTLKGTFTGLKIKPWIGSQAILKGDTKGFFELIDLSTEYNINGTLTTFKWYDKATNQEVGVFASKGTFYAGPANAGKTLICKMTNTLYPDYINQNFILEYEVKISNYMTQGFSAKTMDFKIPENFILTDSKAESSKLNVFPNPVIDVLKINTPLHIETVNVYDYSGNEVKKISPVSNKEVNLQGLSSGNYILTIHTSQGIITKKIIKK